MPDASTTVYTLSFQGMPEVRPVVVSVDGQAALNELFEVSINALIDNDILASVPLSHFLASPVELRITDDVQRPAPPEGLEGVPAWTGIWRGSLTGLRVGDRAGERTLVELSLGPSLGTLAGRPQTRAHLGRNPLDIVKDSLKFGDLTSDKFRFLAKAADYPERDFVLQYEEDLLAFVWRILEREGLALHFDQTGRADVAVITDAPWQRLPILDGDHELTLAALSPGQDPEFPDEPQVFDLKLETTVPPMVLSLRDYNWADPNRPLSVRLSVSPMGRGEIHLHGENFQTEAEGRRLGGIIREEALSAAESVRGQASIPGIVPGYVLTVKGHPVAALNDRFLVVATDFSGSAPGDVLAELGIDFDQVPEYRCHMTLRRLSTPFRPARKTPRPRIPGSLTAWIDGSDPGDLPERDEHGRYKILLPFDVSGRHSGQASAWVRMARPSVGAGYGLDFPLTPGTEVLLTFIDGDPDRPVITGAVANAETGGLKTPAAISGISTRGGNALLFADAKGGHGTALTSGQGRAGLSLGGDAPAEAFLRSDYLNLLNLATMSLNTISSTTVSGQEAGIRATNSGLNTALGVFRASKAASEAAENQAGDQDLDRALSDAVFDEIRTAMRIKGLIAAESPLAPHDHLISITADGDESAGIYRAKKSDGAALAIAYAAIAAQEIAEAQKAVEARLAAEPAIDPASESGAPSESDVHDKFQQVLRAKTSLVPLERELNESRPALEEALERLEAARKALASDPSNPALSAARHQAEEALEELQNAQRPRLTAVLEGRAELTRLDGEYRDLQAAVEAANVKTRKRPAAPVDDGGDPAETISRLIADAVVMMSAHKTPKGLLIKNDDSYVNIKARESASLSAYGPVLIESHQASLGDLLRHGLFDGRLPEELLTPELAGPSGEGFESSKAVLLNSPLVRALAEEISLKARAGLLAQSENLVQLAAGSDDPAGRAASDAALAALLPLHDAFLSAKGGPGEGPALAALLGQAQKLLAIDRGLAKADDVSKGIHLKTREPGMGVLAQTAAADSPIELLQGVPDAAQTPDEATLLRLTNRALLARAGAQASLTLDKNGPAAALRASTATALTMRDGEVALAAARGNILTLKGSKAELEGPAGVSLTAGPTAVEVSPASVTVKSKLLSCSAQLIKLG